MYVRSKYKQTYQERMRTENNERSPNISIELFLSDMFLVEGALLAGVQQPFMTSSFVFLIN